MRWVVLAVLLLPVAGATVYVPAVDMREVTGHEPLERGAAATVTIRTWSQDEGSVKLLVPEWVLVEPDRQYVPSGESHLQWRIAPLKHGAWATRVAFDFVDGDRGTELAPLAVFSHPTYGFSVDRPYAWDSDAVATIPGAVVKMSLEKETRWQLTATAAALPFEPRALQLHGPQAYSHETQNRYGEVGRSYTATPGVDLPPTGVQTSIELVDGTRYATYELWAAMPFEVPAPDTWPQEPVRWVVVGCYTFQLDGEEVIGGHDCMPAAVVRNSPAAAFAPIALIGALLLRRL